MKNHREPASSYLALWFMICSAGHCSAGYCRVFEYIRAIATACFDMIRRKDSLVATVQQSNRGPTPISVQ